MLIRTSGIQIPKNHPKFQEIENSLNRYVETWDGGSQHILFYEDMGDHILIPRFYPVDDPIQDMSCDGADIVIESKVTPNSERQRLVIQEFTHRDNGILQLEPGTGKTVLATCIVSHYKKRAIIIAHKDKLLDDQWLPEFLQHTTLTENDIGRLYSTNYKEVLNKSVILATPHIIAYAVNHEKKEFLEAIKQANIGVMIVDECHVGVGPEQFSKSSLFIPAKRIYGLSATPTRMDGSDDIIHFHLGEVKYFPPEEGELLEPTVYMLYLPFGIYKKGPYFNYGGQFQLSRYYQQMYKSDSYNRVLANWIRNAYKKGRKVLVLGTQIKPLLTLAQKVGADKKDVGIFIPGAQQPKFRKMVEEVTDTKDLSEAFFTKQIVFSTYGACRDGNNRKELDFLVMQTPCSNVEQAVGRILRQLEGKPKPIVVDPIDIQGPEVTIKDDDGNRFKVNWFVRSARNRKKLYDKKGWEIKIYNVKLNDSNCEDD